MSRQKLTIIVTCTDRKSATPIPELMARNLRAGQVGQRAQTWREALSSNQPTTPLLDLYRGESWSQVKLLIATAREVGYQPEVLVASAGLGLRSVHDMASAYAATFSGGHEDTVGSSTKEAQEWWDALPHTATGRRSRSMWVLSENYSRVIATDLTNRFGSGELIVFGGSKEVPSDARIASDRSLRRALGGTATSLNVRMAIQWLRLSRDVGAFSPHAKSSWLGWTDCERHREVYNRRQLTDDAVLDFVTALQTQAPGVSKTSALKSLRDAGLACEQGRFSRLFQKVAVS
ncbi:MAG: hypothetical protein H0U16_05945 [Actinobacteria bacterium]|nr:hypothetical protein [Actinomycetota bacterium]